MEERVREAGIERERALELLKREIRPLHLEQGDAERVVILRGGVVEEDGLSKRVERGRGLARIHVLHATVVGRTRLQHLHRVRVLHTRGRFRRTTAEHEEQHDHSERGHSP